MRRLLYITPYFPPQGRVGALRPLKFVRHLRAHGWEPTVLCDLRKGDNTMASLMAQLPGGLDVRWNYTPLAAGAIEQFRDSAESEPSAGDGAQSPNNGQDDRNPQPATPDPPNAPGSAAAPSEQPGRASWASRVSGAMTLRWSPEFVPLGEHSPEIPFALRAGRRILRSGDFDAIMVNADPYAAMIVGDRLGKAFGIPVIQDLRDPWSVCDLRRQERPAPQRWMVDRMERTTLEGSAAFIVNSEATLDRYRGHYDAELHDKLKVIRNHGDADLISHGTPRKHGKFTALFLGNFRRFLQGDAILRGLAVLRDAGVGPDQFQLLVTGNVTSEARVLAAELGVNDMIVDHPFVPYPEVGAAMDSADLLICLSNASRLRIPAKFYDYAMSRRRILVLADSGHAELRSMTEGLGGATFVDMADVDRIGAALAAAVKTGRDVTIDRSDSGYDSATATAKLVGILNEAAR